MPALPVEIVDRVIEDLWEDKATLKATSLLCRRLQSTAQRVLFDTIELMCTDVRTNDSLKTRLHGLLSPPISSYIRSLFLWVRFTPDGQPEWIAKYGDTVTQFLRTLLELNKLRHLNLYGDAFEVFPDTITICESSTSLRSLDIVSHTYFPIHRCGPWLKHIGANWPEFRLPGPHKDIFKYPMGRRSPIALESLSWHGTTHSVRTWGKEVMMVCDYLLDPRSLIDISCLKRLLFRCMMPYEMDVDFRYLSGILELCRPSLEYLNLAIWNSHRTWPKDFTLDLHTFANLKEVWIEGCDQPLSGQDDFFVWLSKFFAMPMHTFKHLEKGTFRVHFLFEDLRTKDFGVWEVLSNALADREQCPRLRSVEVAVSQAGLSAWSYDQIDSDWLDGFDVQSIEERIGRTMDPLRRLGILKPIKFDWQWQRNLPGARRDITPDSE